ncbi:MAG: DUF5522 domain-containing protein [Sediminibacterium sp.]|nr:DUF5522 domain-containing protein [Sediminibacterium sp.]
MKKNLVESIDFYYDSNGYMVFTEKHHLEKGSCCGHGCRHCPYNYESVPEPKRTTLLEQKKTAGL